MDFVITFAQKGSAKREDFMKIDNLSVSLVLYNDDLEALRQCLDMYQEFVPLSHVFVVDNSPNANRQPVVEALGANYTSRSDNPGFGAGHNVAIRDAAPLSLDYHLVANRDVFLSKDSAQSAIAFLSLNPSVGALNPRIIWPDGSFQGLCKLLPSPLDLIQSYAFNRSITNPQFTFSGFEGKETVHVPFLSGCCLFTRTSVINEVGGFDDRFFMYSEDLDLSRRINRLHDTVMHSKSTAIHLYGGHSKKNLKMLLVHISSVLKYFNKWGWIFDSERRKLNAHAVAKNTQKF